MNQTFQKHFTLEEFKSMFQTFIAFLAVLIPLIDALPQLQTVLNGDWSGIAITALTVAIAKSLLKLVWNQTVIWAKSKSQVK